MTEVARESRSIQRNEYVVDWKDDSDPLGSEEFRPSLNAGRLVFSNLRGVVAVFLMLLVAGCGSIPQNVRQSLVTVVPHDVDFKELEYYARRSKAAYDTPAEIRRQFPDTNRVKTVRPVDVQYFLETDPSRKTQTIAVRGTSNRANRLEDLDIDKVPDSVLGIDLHEGFRADALALQADVTPHLKRDYRVRVTGHSLGGAVAAITAHLLFADGYNVTRLVTFGGPKVTDASGKQAIEDRLDVTRVVNEPDIVPTVPPQTLLIDGYQHFGPEVILRPGRKYVWLPEHDANRLSVRDFWRNLAFLSVKDHPMDVYLPNIQGKVTRGAVQVPYFSSSFTGG